MKHKEISSHIATIKNVSKREAAQMLGVSVRTIENLIYDREIDHVRIGARVLIPYPAIERYNESCMIRAYETESPMKLNRRGLPKMTHIYDQARISLFPELYNAYLLMRRSHSIFALGSGSLQGVPWAF
jgi:excisionase family DNA binding protein